MEPIGLIFKNIDYNPFTDNIGGELMIVHLCLSCGKISCNRIAGDDNSYVITSLLEKPSSLSREVTIRLASHSIKLLTQDDKRGALTSLFGYEYQKYSK